MPIAVRIMSCAQVLAILFAAQGSLLPAQNGEWRVYSPPRAGFSIEAPAALRKVLSCDGEHGASLAPDQMNRWAACYAAIETTPEDSRFLVIVINGRAKFLRSQPRDKLIWYLSVMLIGDDDEPEPTSVAAITANGLTGKEYFYAKPRQVSPNGSTAEIFKRGRIFDTGREIYVLVFVGQNAKDLTSPDAERFFKSFRLRRRIS